MGELLRRHALLPLELGNQSLNQYAQRILKLLASELLLLLIWARYHKVE